MVVHQQPRRAKNKPPAHTRQDRTTVGMGAVIGMGSRDGSAASNSDKLGRLQIGSSRGTSKRDGGGGQEGRRKPPWGVLMFVMTSRTVAV